MKGQFWPIEPRRVGKEHDITVRRQELAPREPCADPAVPPHALRSTVQHNDRRSRRAGDEIGRRDHDAVDVFAIVLVGPREFAHVAETARGELWIEIGEPMRFLGQRFLIRLEYDDIRGRMAVFGADGNRLGVGRGAIAPEVIDRVGEVLDRSADRVDRDERIRVFSNVGTSRCRESRRKAICEKPASGVPTWCSSG